jgi:hypothetical protein
VNQHALTTSTKPGPFIDLNNYTAKQPLAPPGLYTMLYDTPTPNQYQGGGDWIMDTVASSHMGNTPDILFHSQPITSPSSQWLTPPRSIHWHRHHTHFLYCIEL